MIAPGLFEGSVVHHRREPDHRFRMRLALPLLDVDDLAEVAQRHPLWSYESTNAVTLRDADLRPGPFAHEVRDPVAPDSPTGASIADTVRAVVRQHVGRSPRGRVLALAHPRTWGWRFNPIAYYFCLDPTGTAVEHTLVVVTNTPWHEQHPSVLGPPGEHRFTKDLHVSPFFGMDHHYRFRYGAPEGYFTSSIDLLAGADDNVDGADEVVFHAGLALRRRPLDRRHLGRMLWRYPLLTMRVSLGIHTHALRLWRKGAHFHPHPKHASPPVRAKERISP